jgi:hypothetical protein
MLDIRDILQEPKFWAALAGAGARMKPITLSDLNHLWAAAFDKIKRTPRPISLSQKQS